ncbi:MAG: hypothetical protein MUE97_07985 [Phycisphaerales bacterium]|jgi:hypothetical protein|nr:hypothetical protein [Phycisphaerales bacterium]
MDASSSPNSPSPDRAASPPAGDAHDPQQADVILTRLLDGRGRVADWRALRQWTSRDASAWDELLAQSEHADALAALVGQAGTRAASISIAPPSSVAEPAPVLARIDAADAAPAPRTLTSASSATAAPRSDRLGWLVAAMLAVGFVAITIRPGNPLDPAAPVVLGPTAPTTITAGFGGGTSPIFSTPSPVTSALSPDELLGQYVARGREQGRVVGELPQRLVLETRPTSDGKGQEILYVRQIVERAIVPSMYRLSKDDAGQPTIVPAAATQGTLLDEDQQWMDVD